MAAPEDWTQAMLYVDLPAGGRHGWGVVGDNLADALGRVTAIHRLGDEALDKMPQPPGPLLQSVTRPHLQPRRSSAGYTRHVGYTVFEHDLEARRAAQAVGGTYDTLVAASRWAEQALREGGLQNVTTIHHGVDGTRFNMRVAQALRARDEFVIFSGGKFELRKGQDVVVSAFRAFAVRHRDVRLVAAWHNPWPNLTETMVASPHHPLPDDWDGATAVSLRRWMASAALDPDKVSLVPPLPNAELVHVYAASDIGLFPNRCEGSTNLVMMEFMACGRTVIATDFSGHRDVLTDANSLPLRGWQIRPVVRDGRAIACWCEPDVDEIVEKLEFAYQHRDRVARLASKAGDDLSRWTWDRAARAFVDLAEPRPGLAMDDRARGSMGTGKNDDYDRTA